jgi:hypothetical protein
LSPASISHAIDAYALCDSYHRGDHQRIFLNIDLLAPGEARLHLLGKDSSRAEASNELKTRFAKSFGAALIRGDRTENVAIPSSDKATPVHVG